MNYRELSFCNFVASGTNQTRRVKCKGARTVDKDPGISSTISIFHLFVARTFASDSKCNKWTKRKRRDRPRVINLDGCCPRNSTL